MMLNIQQCRALGYCAWGVRRFCKRYGLDFKLLISGTMPAESFAETGDALALRLVRYAEQQDSN